MIRHARIALLATSAALLTGCAYDGAVIRIVEYRAGSIIAGVAGSGIAVHQSGKAEAFAEVEIRYAAERGAVVVRTGGRDGDAH